MYQDGEAFILDFSHNFKAGPHKIEVLGGEECCDLATTWFFSINGTMW